MIKPRILVTGATGKTGRHVVSGLRTAGYPVRALVHREDARSASLQAQGVEVIAADMSDVERLSAALKDVQRAYYCPPFDPYMIQGAGAFVVAAQEARLEHIVGITQWLASPSHPSLMTRQTWLADRLLSKLPGVSHTLVNPGFFAEAYLELLGFAVHMGVFPWIFGESRNAPPCAEDIAAVVVEALKDPDRHAGKRYRPTGPDLLGAEEMAQAIGRALGHPVKAVPTPEWVFMKGARYAGIPIDILSSLRYYIRDHLEGAFAVGAPTTDVLDVTDRAAESFESIVRRHAALPQHRKTFGNRVRQVLSMMVTPFLPAYDLKRYDRELRRPFPSQPQLARQSAVWQREHGGDGGPRSSVEGRHSQIPAWGTRT